MHLCSKKRTIDALFSLCFVFIYDYKYILLLLLRSCVTKGSNELIETRRRASGIERETQKEIDRERERDREKEMQHARFTHDVLCLFRGMKRLECYLVPTNIFDCFLILQDKACRLQVSLKTPSIT